MFVLCDLLNNFSGCDNSLESYWGQPREGLEGLCGWDKGYLQFFVQNICKIPAVPHAEKNLFWVFWVSHGGLGGLLGKAGCRGIFFIYFFIAKYWQKLEGLPGGFYRGKELQKERLPGEGDTGIRGFSVAPFEWHCNAFQVILVL